MYGKPLEKWMFSSPVSCECLTLFSPGGTSNAVTRHCSFSSSVYHFRLRLPSSASPRQPCCSSGTEWMPTRMTWVWMLPWLITYLHDLIAVPFALREIEACPEALEGGNDRSSYPWYFSPRAISHRR